MLMLIIIGFVYVDCVCWCSRKVVMWIFAPSFCSFLVFVFVLSIGAYRHSACVCYMRWRVPQLGNLCELRSVAPFNLLKMRIWLFIMILCKTVSWSDQAGINYYYSLMLMYISFEFDKFCVYKEREWYL